METSIWSTSLAEFREKVASADPVPAGVAIAAVTASLALALVAKVLEISRRRGDAKKIEASLTKTRHEALLLSALADDDVRAFNRYLDSKSAGLQAVIRVPIEAVRAAVRGIDLCREASVVCSTGLIAADLDAAELLLSGAARAMLISVESNLKQLPEDDSFRGIIAQEVLELRNRVERQTRT